MVFWSCIKAAWLERSVKFQNLWCHILAMHILPNISKSKGNQTMKSRQFMEYYITNIFLEKSFTKYGGETVPRPFLKNQNWKFFWIVNLIFYTVCFYCMPSWGLSKYIESKMQTTSFYLINSFFEKQKEVWN